MHEKYFHDLLSSKVTPLTLFCDLSRSYCKGKTCMFVERECGNKVMKKLARHAMNHLETCSTDAYSEYQLRLDLKRPRDSARTSRSEITWFQCCNKHQHMNTACTACTSGSELKWVQSVVGLRLYDGAVSYAEVLHPWLILNCHE
jgi:hypothetical protein